MPRSEVRQRAATTAQGRWRQARHRCNGRDGLQERSRGSGATQRHRHRSGHQLRGDHRRLRAVPTAFRRALECVIAPLTQADDFSRDVATFVKLVGESEYCRLLSNIGKGLNVKRYVTRLDDLRFSLELQLFNLELLRQKRSGKSPAIQRIFMRQLISLSALARTDSTSLFGNSEKTSWANYRWFENKWLAFRAT